MNVDTLVADTPTAHLFSLSHHNRGDHESLLCIQLYTGMPRGHGATIFKTGDGLTPPLRFEARPPNLHLHGYTAASFELPVTL